MDLTFLLVRPVTVVIIALNCVIFLLIRINVFSVKDLGSSYIMTIQNRQYYRAVTSAFTHREFMHIFFNMYSLYNVGSVIERMIGMKLYIIAYAVITIIGGLVSSRIHKKKSSFTLSIGASGVICGLLGIYMTIAFLALGLAGIKSVIPTIVLLVLMTFSPQIDSIGHFTGLLLGIVFGVVIMLFF